MMAGDELVRFLFVATRAVFGRDDGGNDFPIVIEGVDIPFFCLMALDAPDAFDGMGTSPPVVDDSRRRLTMAVDA